MSKNHAMSKNHDNAMPAEFVVANPFYVEKASDGSLDNNNKPERKKNMGRICGTVCCLFLLAIIGAIGSTTPPLNLIFLFHKFS